VGVIVANMNTVLRLMAFHELHIYVHICIAQYFAYTYVCESYPAAASQGAKSSVLAVSRTMRITRCDIDLVLI
jgi:hypothetical protein